MPDNTKSNPNSAHNKPVKTSQWDCQGLPTLGQNLAVTTQYNRSQSISIEILRSQAHDKMRALSKVFQFSKDKICEYFTHYHTFPLQGYPHFNDKQLIQSQNLKLIKSQTKLYFGQIYNKKRQGKGVAVNRNGKIYEGLFQKNERCGFGVEIYPNNDLYIGDFLNSKKHGKGRFYWFSLSKGLDHKNLTVQYYQGHWWCGLPDGFGIHCKVNGDYYEGTFKNGLKHGKGTQKLDNGETYTGQYVNGLPEGFGQYHWPDGSSYRGSLKQGLRCGQGCWTLQSDSHFKLSKSLKNRYRSLQLKDEVKTNKILEKYEGHYNMDKKSGYGIYKWDNDWTYYGNFQKDFRNGYGQLYNQNVLVYKGNWLNGQKADDIIGRQALALGNCPQQRLVKTTKALGVKGGIGVGRNNCRFTVSNAKQQIFKQTNHLKLDQIKQAIQNNSNHNRWEKTYRSANMGSIQDPPQNQLNIRKNYRETETFQVRKYLERCFDSIFEEPQCQFKHQIQYFSLMPKHEIKLKEGSFRRPRTSSLNCRKTIQKKQKILAHQNIVNSRINRLAQDKSRFSDVYMSQKAVIDSSLNL